MYNIYYIYNFIIKNKRNRKYYVCLSVFWSQNFFEINVNIGKFSNIK